MLARIALLGTAIHSVSKSGVVSLARTTAVEPGPFGIRVNPSITRRPMTRSRITANADVTEAHPYAVEIPFGCLAELEEIAQAVPFLLPDRASYVNGHALVVDGGQSAT